MLMELTPEQRESIRRLLEEELRAGCRSAIDSGAQPADVADLVAERRQAVEDLLFDLADDPEHPVDDPREGRGIGEQG
jgi:hypothetical protein